MYITTLLYIIYPSITHLPNHIIILIQYIIKQPKLYTPLTQSQHYPHNETARHRAAEQEGLKFNIGLHAQSAHPHLRGLLTSHLLAHPVDLSYSAILMQATGSRFRGPSIWRKI